MQGKVARTMCAAAALLTAAGPCGCGGERYTLSDEDKALYGAIIEQETSELLELNPDHEIGYRLTFAELTGDEHAEMIITMCTESRNNTDYIYTIKDGKVYGEASWIYPALDGNLLVDEEGTVFNHFDYSPEIDGAEISFGYVTRYGNGHSPYFDYAAVTSADKDAFIAGVDRVMWMGEGYHFIPDDELQKYETGSGYGFYAFEMYEALRLDETAADEVITVDISTNALVIGKETYDRLMEKEFEGLTDKNIPALTSEVITAPDGFDFSALKDITL